MGSSQASVSFTFGPAGKEKKPQCGHGGVSPMNGDDSAESLAQWL